jgi:hypothetical protein
MLADYEPVFSLLTTVKSAINSQQAFDRFCTSDLCRCHGTTSLIQIKFSAVVSARNMARDRRLLAVAGRPGKIVIEIRSTLLEVSAVGTSLANLLQIECC